MNKCIFCHDTGKCKNCNGTGKFGSTLKCSQCGGTGKCSHCRGSSSGSSSGFGARPSSSFGTSKTTTHSSFGGSSFGQTKTASHSHAGGSSFGGSSFGQSKGSFGGSSGGFGTHQHSSINQEPREDPFEKARQVVAKGIDLLKSGNPANELTGIEMINSPDGWHSRKLAYGTALEVYERGSDDEVMYQLMNLIYAFGKGDPKAYEHFRHAANTPKPEMAYLGSLGLISLPQGVEEGLQRLRYAFDAGNAWLQRRAIGEIGKMGQQAEPVLDLVTRNLGSRSWLMRRTTKKAVKGLKKADVNVVGFLVNKLMTGSTEEKISACTGLGTLGSDAKDSVDALSIALKDTAIGVREKAAWALWQMEKNAAPAESALQSALQDESPAVSMYALKALSKFSKITKEQKDLLKDLEEHEKEIKQVQKTWGMKDKEEPKEEKEDESAPPKAPEQEYKNRFFMSHSTKDFVWVQKVAKVIESWPGCKAWLCERDIFHGQDWMEAIYDGIEECNWYVLFWSQNAENSKWTMEEIREAKLRNVESNDTFPKVTIVNLGMSEMPRLLTRHQGSKVTKDEDIPEFTERLKSQVEF